MKKVPLWIRKVIAFCNHYPCADTREGLIKSLQNGTFDYVSFDNLCRTSHLAYDENGIQITEIEHNHGAFHNQWEAIQAAGKTGTIKSMQGVLHEIFNNTL